MSMTEERRLPEGWKWVQIVEIADRFSPGQLYDTKGLHSAGKTPVVTQSVEGYAGYHDNPAGVYATTENPIVTFANHTCAVRFHESSFSTIQNVFPLRGKFGIADTRFLFWLLKFQISSSFYGGHWPLLSEKRLPLPPLPEQKRIAAILTEQMAAVEKARAAAEAQFVAAKALPGAYSRKIFPQPGQDLQEGWKWVKLIDLCTRSGQYGTSRKSNAQGAGLPVLGMYHIHEGQIRWANVATIDLPENERKQYLLKAGDLLFNRTNSAELVGKTAVYDRVDDAVFASYLIRFHIDSSLADSHYVSAYINSSTARLFIEKNMARAIGQVNISASTMHGCPIPIPPLPEQKRIAGILNEQITETEKLRKAIEDQLKEINALPSALLRKAFNGEL